MKKNKFFTVLITGRDDAFYLVSDGEKEYIEDFWGTDLNPKTITRVNSPWNGFTGGLDFLVNEEYFNDIIKRYYSSVDAGDKEPFKSIDEFKERFGNTITQFANMNGVETKYLEAFVYCESSTGSGFYNDGRMLIRFENGDFVKYAELPKELVDWSNGPRYEYYRTDLESGEWIPIHAADDDPSGNDPNYRYAALQWALSLNEEAAYKSISMGFPQIMGFNYEAVGYNSAKEMYNDFSSGYTAQINGFMSFLENDRGGAILTALKNNNIEDAIRLYNGPGDINKYLNAFNEYLNNQTK